MKGRCPPGARGTEELSSGHGQNSTSRRVFSGSTRFKTDRRCQQAGLGRRSGGGGVSRRSPAHCAFRQATFPPARRPGAGGWRPVGALGAWEPRHTVLSGSRVESPQRVQGTWRGAGESPKKIDKNRKLDLSARRERFQSLPRAGYAPIFRGRERPPPRAGTQPGSPAQRRGWRLHLQVC